MGFRYQDLKMGEEILQFIDVIYRLTGSFPSEEKYGLTSQIRRAATSIYLNIAEGSARKSPKDFMRFLTISQGSLVETHAACMIAKRLGYIKEEDFRNIDQTTQSLWFKIHALRESQARRFDQWGFHPDYTSTVSTTSTRISSYFRPFLPLSKMANIS